MSEFQTGLPSVRQVQGFIKDKQDGLQINFYQSLLYYTFDS